MTRGPSGTFAPGAEETGNGKVSRLACRSASAQSNRIQNQSEPDASNRPTPKSERSVSESVFQPTSATTTIITKWNRKANRTDKVRTRTRTGGMAG